MTTSSRLEALGGRGKQPGVPLKPVPDFDPTELKLLAKQSTKKTVRDGFLFAIEKLVQERNKSNDLHLRNLRLQVAMRAMTSRRAWRRVRPSLGESFFIPPTVNPGDLLIHPDGRRWKVGSDGVTLIELGTPEGLVQ